MYIDDRKEEIKMRLELKNMTKKQAKAD